MARKNVKTTDIERFLMCDLPSGSEYSNLSEDDTEIIDENVFIDDYLSDDLCFDQEEFERLMNEYDTDAQNYQLLKNVNKQNVSNNEIPSTSKNMVNDKKKK